MLSLLDPAELPVDAVEIGRIAEAWGIKGWFKVLPYSADPEALFSSKCWFILPSEKGAKTFAGVLALAVKEAKVHSDTVVACALGVEDRYGVHVFLSHGRVFRLRQRTSITGSI